MSCPQILCLFLRRGSGNHFSMELLVNITFSRTYCTDLELIVHHFQNTVIWARIIPKFSFLLFKVFDIVSIGPFNPVCKVILLETKMDKKNSFISHIFMLINTGTGNVNLIDLFLNS